MMKRLLCIVITVMIVMSVCTTVGAEQAEQRVERIYPNWKEDYEQWNNKGLVDEYDIETRALVVAVIEHESRFQGDVGGKYRGLMQISTSKNVLKFLGVSKDELYNEKTNIRCGVKMLSYYLEKSEGNVEHYVCMDAERGIVAREEHIVDQAKRFIFYIRSIKIYLNKKNITIFCLKNWKTEAVSLNT